MVFKIAVALMIVWTLIMSPPLIDIAKKSHGLPKDPGSVVAFGAFALLIGAIWLVPMLLLGIVAAIAKFKERRPKHVP